MIAKARKAERQGPRLLFRSGVSKVNFKDCVLESPGMKGAQARTPTETGAAVWNCVSAMG